MCGHLKFKRLSFETESSVFSMPRSQPLLLMKIERPTNLTLDKMKYEYAKPYCPLSKTDFESDKEWATEPAFDFEALQLTNKIECQMKVCIKGIL